MNKKFIVKVFAVVLMLSGLTSAGSMESLSREQKAALTYAIKNITYCDHYSVNDGANKPYDKPCVDNHVQTVLDDLNDL